MTTATTQKTSSSPRPLKGTRVGVVISDRRDKTRTVSVDHLTRHTKYGKIMRRSTRFQVHDADNISRNGDRVEIVNCRPISKTKSWRLVRVVVKAISDESATLTQAQQS